MENQSFEVLRQQSQLNEATLQVRDIWYQLAEGFYSITTDYRTYSSLIEQLQSKFPNGWQLQIDEKETIKATFVFTNGEGTLTVEKQSSGKESILVTS
ncbi:hypothetical protein [Desertibacillus haloalkaliphilus]|uniref:hypothetical protein n=1 Tax=Desertibacillus haloalkaliphilus TaxID=1328930 RepID=UPI001C262D5F|nr:hypothetical protein [Desertibacillus haloalkaliphilus]MBU8907697.1 hypothetical protein [Desertibacillus haloalkaliphilus]